MSKKFVRNITNTKLRGKENEPFYTNEQNDLLSDKEDVFVRNQNEYHCLTDNIKSVTSDSDLITVDKTGKNTRRLKIDEKKIVELDDLSSKDSNLIIDKNADTGKVEFDLSNEILTSDKIKSKNDNLIVTKENNNVMLEVLNTGGSTNESSQSPINLQAYNISWNSPDNDHVIFYLVLKEKITKDELINNYKIKFPMYDKNSEVGNVLEYIDLLTQSDLISEDPLIVSLTEPNEMVDALAGIVDGTLLIIGLNNIKNYVKTFENVELAFTDKNDNVLSNYFVNVKGNRFSSSKNDLGLYSYFAELNKELDGGGYRNTFYFYIEKEKNLNYIQYEYKCILPIVDYSGENVDIPLTPVFIDIFNEFDEKLRANSSSWNLETHTGDTTNITGGKTKGGIVIVTIESDTQVFTSLSNIKGKFIAKTGLNIVDTFTLDTEKYNLANNL